MSPLEFVKPTQEVHLNVLLYGPPKTGKTTGAATAPGRVLYLNADRPNATRFAHRLHGDRISEARVTGLETLIEAHRALTAGQFDSVVLDPVGDVYRILVDELSGGSLRPAIQNYGDAGTHLERWCRSVCELPVTVVLVTHDLPLQDDASGEVERLPWTGSKNPAIGRKLMAMVDVFGYTGVVLPQSEGEAKRYMVQLVDFSGRHGGDRFGCLGDSREINVSEWEEVIRGQAQGASQGAPQGASAGQGAQEPTQNDPQGDSGQVQRVDTPLGETLMDERAVRVLKANGFEMVSDLTLVTAPQLLKMPNVGQGTLANARKLLEDHGLAFKPVETTTPQEANA